MNDNPLLWLLLICTGSFLVIAIQAWVEADLRRAVRVERFLERVFGFDR